MMMEGRVVPVPDTIMQKIIMIQLNDFIASITLTRRKKTQKLMSACQANPLTSSLIKTQQHATLMIKVDKNVYDKRRISSNGNQLTGS